MNLKDIIECSRALDLPHDEGVQVLERHGWSYAGRFELPASEFVKRLQDSVLS
ncbi:MAG: hypothetical protein ABUJ92_00035 [Desulfobacterales bacterium]